MGGWRGNRYGKRNGQYNVKTETNGHKILILVVYKTGTRQDYVRQEGLSGIPVDVRIRWFTSMGRDIELNNYCTGDMTGTREGQGQNKLKIVLLEA